MPSGHLLLIRHGQSTWNASGRWQGQADPPLSETGEQQARYAATRLAGVPGITAISSSHLERARRTAEILAEGAGLPLLDPIEDFQERHIGPWEGLTRVEIEERWPGFLEQRQRPDDVETDDDILVRAGSGAAALVEAHAESHGGIAVVSHGGVIIAVERDAGAPQGTIPNLNGRWFTWTDGAWAAEGDRLDLVDGFVETRPDDPDYA